MHQNISTSKIYTAKNNNQGLRERVDIIAWDAMTGTTPGKIPIALVVQRTFMFFIHTTVLRNYSVIFYSSLINDKSKVENPNQLFIPFV
jgi:hypothetical protein